MRLLLLLLPIIFCGLSSATSSFLSWLLVWLSILSFPVVFYIVFIHDEVGPDFVASYNWQDNRGVGVHVGSQYGGVSLFPEVSEAAYKCAVDILNQGPPSGRAGEIPYKTEVHVAASGDVIKVVDEFIQNESLRAIRGGVQRPTNCSARKE